MPFPPPNGDWNGLVLAVEFYCVRAETRYVDIAGHLKHFCAGCHGVGLFKAFAVFRDLAIEADGENKGNNAQRDDDASSSFTHRERGILNAMWY